MEEIINNVAEEEISDTISFEDLGLDQVTLEAIQRKGFVTPSPIQVLAIPRLLNGDAPVIAKARTGTGKTAAFGLPIVQNLRTQSDHVRAIILEPTRELAMQTAKEMASFTTGVYPRTAVVYGGAPMGEQIRSLKKGVEIVTGTPGRIQDLIDRGVLDISKIDYFILDEGDEMLDMGFVDDIKKIFESASKDCRVLLFSATIPNEILKIAQEFMGEYEIVEEEGHEEAPLLIDQKYWVLKDSEKIEALVRLIDYSPDFFGLVFVQRKSDADYVSKSLDEKGYEAAALHGDIPQGQREKILARFRAKKTRILVATDVAARGIDIEGVTHVVNYDLPFDGPTYVHRIGRTGRAGAEGNAITFVRPEETRRKLQFLKAAVKKSAKGEMTEGIIPKVEEVIEAKRERLFSHIKEKIGIEGNSAQETDEEIIPLPSDTESTDNTEASVPHLRMGDPVFARLAEELCSGRNPEEVVASLLAATYGKELNKNRYGKITPVASKSRDGRRGEVREDQMRIYVQLGWDDGYNPRKIADFFHDLLGVPGRKVDAIDMSDKFSLLTLPLRDAQKAIAMSDSDKSLPHMHQDTKVSRDSFGEGRRERSSRRRDRDFGGDRRRSSREFGREERSSRSERAKSSSHSRERVHTATKRSGKAAAFKKGNQEY